ncbi:hypothetical protein MCAG_03851 [Micromonospora sp. ATCC 39149]|uniref:hypothetical protein n=1 Tax=Micromonospora sp. (strain ATCC 39149 / NRRL 15099 / SCC 1413) TaxID=219305 RepID=UPI0001A5058C|nr:hypothetical protein [Micromonospora sp. ATCC 39149]EEP73524.1 hypothetical protein MCAG_03851 [Micromonospora sp. ATCC 39149]
MTCDICGLPDPYQGQGDGIGSCDCPRCECGTPRGSYLCTCDPDDPDAGWDDDGQPWPDDVTRPVDTVHLPAHDIA